MWSRAMLGVLWALQASLLLLLVSTTAFYAAAMSTMTKLEGPGFGAWLFMELSGMACLVLIAIEIICHCQAPLKIQEYFIIQSLKVTWWTIVTVVDMAVLIRFYLDPWQEAAFFFISLAVFGSVWISFGASLMYALWVHRRTQHFDASGETAPLLE